MTRAPKHRFRNAISLLRGMVQQTTPIEFATSILVAGIGSTLLADMAINGTDNTGWLKPVIALPLLVFAGGSLSYLVVVITLGGFSTWRWLRTDARGGLTFLAAVGLVAILVQLWTIDGGRQAYLQTTAGVLGAAFIALAIQRPQRHDSEPPMPPEE